MAALPAEIQRSIEYRLNVKIKKFLSLSGGCINHSGLLQTQHEKYFIKWNTVHGLRNMFEAESRALQIISNTKSIRVPHVLFNQADERHQYLLLEFISSASPSKNYWQTFGHQLAVMHKTTSDTFGLDHDNYMGALPQSNIQKEDWIEFFINNRLVPQVKRALEKELVDRDHVLSFEALYRCLPSLLAVENPTLIHGDLWRGNVMIDETGLPCLIDPALYFGNREIDIAMTYLFGGFDSTYIEYYNDIYPLVNGYKQRLEIYNLYPLLVHLNLFGKNYLTQLVSILNKYV